MGARVSHLMLRTKLPFVRQKRGQPRIVLTGINNGISASACLRLRKQHQQQQQRQQQQQQQQQRQIRRAPLVPVPLEDWSLSDVGVPTSRGQNRRRPSTREAISLPPLMLTESDGSEVRLALLKRRQNRPANHRCESEQQWRLGSTSPRVLLRRRTSSPPPLAIDSLPGMEFRPSRTTTSESEHFGQNGGQNLQCQHQLKHQEQRQQENRKKTLYYYTPTCELQAAGIAAALNNDRTLLMLMAKRQGCWARSVVADSCLVVEVTGSSLPRLIDFLGHLLATCQEGDDDNQKLLPAVLPQ